MIIGTELLKNIIPIQTLVEQANVHCIALVKMIEISYCWRCEGSCTPYVEGAVHNPFAHLSGLSKPLYDLWAVSFKVHIESLQIVLKYN